MASFGSDELGVLKEIGNLIDAFKEIASIVGNFSNTYTYHSLTCNGAFEYTNYPHYALIPACLVIIFYCFLIRRKRLWLDILDGRPGIVYPMNILTTRESLAYAACYGVFTTLIYKLIFEDNHAFPDYDGPAYARAFITLISLVIYGINCFPLFASVALQSIPSYFIGSLVAWTLTVLTLVSYSGCDLSGNYLLSYFAMNICQLISLFYLCVRLPYGLYRKVKLWWKTGLYVQPRRQWAMKKIKRSPEGLHVRALLKPRKREEETSDNLVETCAKSCMNYLKGIVKYWIYTPHKDFRYSSRILSIMWVGFALLYTAAFKLCFHMTQIFYMLTDGVHTSLNTIGWSERSGDSTIRNLARTIFLLWYYIFYFLWIFQIVVCVMTFLIGVLGILYSLMSYRENLLAMYRGDFSLIPERSKGNNIQLLHGSFRYAGYQVAYIAWAFYIVAFSIMALSIALVFAFAIIILAFSSWFSEIILLIFPYILLLVIVYVVQYLLIRCVFLQDQEHTLAMKNRRALFTTAYFMFFINCIIGVGSCFYRLTQSLVLGMGTISRLDMSLLNRKYEHFDGGFERYVGFLYVEYFHTHPVMLTFVRLLDHGCRETQMAFGALQSEGRKQKGHKNNAVSAVTDAPQQKGDGATVTYDATADKRPETAGGVVVHIQPQEKDAWEKAKESPEMAKHRKRQLAAFNWALAVTLLFNPTLIAERKNYLAWLKQKRAEGEEAGEEDEATRELWINAEKQKLVRGIWRLRAAVDTLTKANKKDTNTWNIDLSRVTAAKT